MTTCRLNSPHRVLMISTNLGWGHEDLRCDCCSITFWGGVASSSLPLVAYGWSLLWAASRDPFGWACVLWLQLWLQLQWGSTRVGSASLGKVTSTQLEGAGVERTSVKVTRDSIAHQSSNTLSTKWRGSPGIGSWAFSAQYWRALA